MVLATDEFNPEAPPEYKLLTGVSSRTVEGLKEVAYNVDVALGMAVFNLTVTDGATYYVDGTEAGVDAVAVHNAKFKVRSRGVKLTAKKAAQIKQLKANAAAGRAREIRVYKKLEGRFKTASIQRERYLRTADGKIARDPLTGKARRIDPAVIESGKPKHLVETTSKTATKKAQLLKEARIRAAGGTSIRDKLTGKLVDVLKVLTRVSRRL